MSLVQFELPPLRADGMFCTGVQRDETEDRYYNLESQMTRASSAGTTDYSHQSFHDMVSDLKDWIANLEKTLQFLEGGMNQLEGGYLNLVDPNIVSSLQYSKRFFRTSVDEITNILAKLERTVEPNHVARIRHLGKTANELNHRLGKIWNSRIMRDDDYNNPNFFRLQSLHGQTQDMVADMLDLDNLAKRLEDFVGVSESNQTTEPFGRARFPVGSPFGFTKYDWETVKECTGRKDVLYIALGYQFRSDYYDSEELKKNINSMFVAAANEYNSRVGQPQIKIGFSALGAGYGEHLFNEIAREIISSDIAVFETSGINPNVMIELGVALTWGIPVLPIKRADQPTPSDISGQTWADYEDSGSKFLDPEHAKKLLAMIERAVRRKSNA